MKKKSGSKLVLIKHAMPIPEATKAAKDWNLGDKGKTRAKLLAERLRLYLPFSLYSSKEPKAKESAEVISSELGINFITVEGLEEIDRPVLPWLSQIEHRDFNKRLFETPDRPVVGKESANQALERFCQAIHGNIEKALIIGNVVIVTHGTVISLFVEEHNQVDAFELWKSGFSGISSSESR
jgi:broad specificity phosphatase PhoE